MDYWGFKLFLIKKLYKRLLNKAQMWIGSKFEPGVEMKLTRNSLIII